ncbi:MAG TPA: ion channel [Caulobacteraceae bacterium]|jgi:inward rectifier potassium channel|nr:ion channel [Caulobacteraceae bacterium]
MDQLGPARQRTRLGSADVAYIGGVKAGWSDVYHRMLTMPLWAFLSVMLLGYLSLNALFALLYMLQPGAIEHARRGDFLDHFFFSVQTLGTLGYGVMSPRTRWANLLVTAETFVGLFNLGIATSLLFARISRPTARIMFSRIAVVSPLEGAPTLMFRAANRRMNLVLEAEVSVSLVRDIVTSEGETMRRFEELPLLRARTPLFFLTWQVMHRIDPSSPLFGLTQESLEAMNGEVVVVMRGLDETFVSTIHARTSYLPDEIVFGRKLADVMAIGPDGRRRIDFTRFHEVE